MRASRLTVLWLLALTASACGSHGRTSDDGPVDAPRFGNRRAHLDLLELRHLAEIDHHGLYVDFGTPARMKYTIGNWRTGFGRDEATGGTTITPIEGRTARIYFQADRARKLRIRLRGRPYGTTNMVVYLNETALGTVRFAAGAALADYDVEAPARAVLRGENCLRLHFGSATRVGNRTLALALDSLRVMDGSSPAAESFEPPVYGELASRVRAGSSRRRALSVVAPTTLSFYVEVPPHAALGLGIAADGGDGDGASARIVITPDGGASTEMLAHTVTDQWRDVMLSLERWAGQVVRLDLRAESPEDGGSRVAWSQPTILVPPPARPSNRERRVAKNVVLVVIDTLRADRVRAVEPRTRVQTPAFDRLARDGTLFTAAQATETWTKPTTASILTGLSPTTHHAKTGYARLSGEATLLSEMLSGAGITTGAFVASDYVSRRFGFEQGWSHYRNYITEHAPSDAATVVRDAGDWIEAHQRERFFAYLHTVEPHAPYDPPAEYLRMYDADEYSGQVVPADTVPLINRARQDPPAVILDARDRARLDALYDGEVTHHDAQLATLVARLERLGLLDQTLFVVVSDHGEELADHGSYGHSHSVYQELVHVPLVFRLPGRVGARRIDAAVSAMDILPTVLEMTGVRVPAFVEARSLVGYMEGAPPPGPAVAFSELFEERQVIRAGRWKLALRGVSPTFFDLASDPQERNALASSSHPIAMRYCRILLGQYLGASNRSEWLSAVPSRPGLNLPREHDRSDEALCRRLAALGYATGACAPNAGGDGPPPM